MHVLKKRGWELPDSWECPECGAAKSEFYPIIESN